MFNVGDTAIVWVETPDQWELMLRVDIGSPAVEIMHLRHVRITGPVEEYGTEGIMTYPVEFLDTHPDIDYEFWLIPTACLTHEPVWFEVVEA